MVTINDIIDFLHKQKLNYDRNKLADNGKKEILGPNNILDADQNEIAFISKKYEEKGAELLKSTRASVVFCYQSINIAKNSIDIIVPCDDPKKWFLLLLSELFAIDKEVVISNNSFIHESATYGKNFSLGHYSVIEEDVSIGDEVFIGSHVTIKKGTKIGNNVTIEDGSIIGGKGFGYVKSDKGENIEFPHYGKVIIEDDVYIGSNTTIDRGALSNTMIKRGVKIDNLVHIAHNAAIGENSLVIACSLIAGSVVMGQNCWIAPASTIRNGIKLGDNVTVGLASLVTKNVKPNSTVLGIPALDLQDFKKYQEVKKEIIQSKTEDAKR